MENKLSNTFLTGLKSNITYAFKRQNKNCDDCKSEHMSDVVFCVAVPGIYCTFLFIVGFEIEAQS